MNKYSFSLVGVTSLEKKLELEAKAMDRDAILERMTFFEMKN